MNQRFKKKPVVIEAYQTGVEIDITTLEGVMHANVGDWIITGVKGEQYPCKPDIFEKTYEPVFENTQDLTFGEAIEALKQGKFICRKGWNGKGMFLWLKPATTIKSEWCKDPILKNIVELNGGETEALGTICMKTADNKILTGWLASQTDMLSNDWCILNFPPKN